MKHYGLKLFFAAAFALTLALKVLLNQGMPAPADPELFENAVASFLDQHGFASRLETRSRWVFVQAKAENCRMLIREAEPHGWDNSRIEFLTKEVGQVKYVFDGAVYEHEPFPAPVIGQYWTILRSKMGLSPNRHPVLAVAASDDCAIDRLPWRELSILTGRERSNPLTGHSLFPDFPVKFAKDLIAIASISANGNALSFPPSLDIRNLSDLVGRAPPRPKVST